MKPCLLSLVAIIMSLLLRARSFVLPGHLRSTSLRRNDLSRSIILSASSSEISNVEDEIAKVNGGKPINVNSPSQVSQAIFGTVQSTSRKYLLEAASPSSNLDSQKRSLATLVLKYRDLQSAAKTQSRKKTSAPTVLEEVVIEEIDVEKDIVDGNAINPKSTPLVVTEGSYEYTVQQMLCSGKSKMHPYWNDPLVKVSKPSARLMVAQLNADICPMGYDPLAVPNDPLRRTGEGATTTAGKKGSLLAYVREQKERFPECILLVRVGEFYESFGMDAVMLVEHCGLNAMAGKCRAGCPLRNIQATLDSLTAQGFKVAVYEEATDTDASPGPGAKSRLKNRMLGQIVSSAAPTYLYDLVLLGNSDLLASSQESRPYVGVISNAAGYTMVEISMEERSVRVSERLTPEAVSCRLTAYPPVDPLFYVGDANYRSLPFLSSSNASRVRIKAIPSSLVEAQSSGATDVERAKRIIVRALIGMGENGEDDSLTESDFSLALTEPTQPIGGTQTNPIYVETATQLGLMGDKTIPPLVASLLPESSPAACRRFLRRWLLNPPPPEVAYSMASLIVNLKDRGQALPPMSVPPVGKVVALLRAGQASAHAYGEVLSALDSTLKTMYTYPWIDPLMTLLEFESGIAADPDSIKARCLEAVKVIEGVVSPFYHAAVSSPDEHDRISDFDDLIPSAFFDRNEASWRGRVQQEVCNEAYRLVDEAAVALAKAVATDFWGFEPDKVDAGIVEAKASKSPIVQDIFNNMFAVKAIPEHGDEQQYFHPRDRNGKILRNRYTTAAVQEALSDYVTACDQACHDVTLMLTNLSRRLCDDGHLPAIVQAAHFNLIMATASQHAAKSNLLGWSMAEVVDNDVDRGKSAGYFSGVWPYWMDKSSAVSNTFDLDGMFLLTAPNMSGKSTVMRATAAVALLTSCGLCAPLESDSVIRRFDNLFVRGASSDIPSENLSAFGAEVLDVSALLRCCTQNSLVFVDELGRGTSPRDGTSIAAAVMEAMAESGMSGVFATHLHEIFDLPLKGSERIRNKQIAIDESENGMHSSSYLLKDGICIDSLAMLTAAKFGFPDSVLDRAKLFSKLLEKNEASAAEQMTNHHVPLSLSKSGQSFSKQTLEDAIRAIDDIEGCSGNAILIPPGWNAPPLLEGNACLYILEVQGGSNRFYVGETDSITRRLKQHRTKGGPWMEASAAVIRIKAGKSEARSIESRVIRKLAASGFDMLSVADGRTIRHTTANNHQTN